MVSVTRRRFLATAAALIGTTSIAVATGCAPAATPTAAPKAAESTKAPAAATTQAPAGSPAAGATQAPAGSPAAGATQAPAAKPSEAAKPTAAPAATFKGSTLAFLGGTYFIAAAQELFTKQIKQWGTDNGVTVSADYMAWPDLQAKIAATIASGSGADVFELWPQWPYLYKDALLDVTDLAEEFGKAGGGYLPYITNDLKMGNQWFAISHGNTNGGYPFRLSYYKEAGIDVSQGGKGIDLTWEQYFDLGKKLKAKGHPLGQAMGHSLGDPPGFAYPYMWSYGAMEVEKDGKTVAFNKPEFVDAVKRFVQAWKDGYDETALSGDDSYNNRAFAADQISSTYNGSSVYEAVKKDQPEIAKDTDHHLIPKGPAGRFYMLGAKSMGIFKKSKNVEAGKAFWKWWFDEKQYGEWYRLQKGYQLAPTQKWADDPLWNEDPKMWAFKEQVKYGRDFGWAGNPGEKPVLVWSKYIVGDTLAKALGGMDPAAAVKWGADEIQKIYNT